MKRHIRGVLLLAAIAFILLARADASSLIGGALGNQSLTPRSLNPGSLGSGSLILPAESNAVTPGAGSMNFSATNPGNPLLVLLVGF